VLDSAEQSPQVDAMVLLWPALWKAPFMLGSAPRGAYPPDVNRAMMRRRGP